MTEKTKECTAEKTNECTEERILNKLDEMGSEISALKDRITSLRADIRIQAGQNPNLVTWFRTLKK